MMQDQQYEHQSECEDYADYGPDGYHPVTLGQKYNHVYTVIQKLGWGHFSTVWLVQHQVSKQYYALKIQRSKDNHAESALDELQILDEVRKHESDASWVEQLKAIEQMHPQQINAKLCRPLLLIDNFAHHGIHGKHYCSVFELMGPNLLDVIQHYEFKDEKMPLWLVKKITIDVLLGLVYLHEHCKIIHTDLKPENIMIKLEPQQQQQLVENIKKYTVKPISMKYLKNLQTSKNSKSKKKNEKKKQKKKQKKDLEQKQNNEQDEDVSASQEAGQSQSISQPRNQEGSAIQEEKRENNTQKSTLQGTQIKQQMQEEKEEPLKPENAQEKKEGIQASQQKEGDMKEEVNMKILKWKNVEIELNNKLFFKIVDMGNACFESHHYTEEIQTRQYRAPQVILGYSYTYNTDVWSLACTVFEMLTNNFLFKPKKIQGISKDEDHLYKIIEVLGPMSKQYSLGGRNSASFFNKKGKLLNGHPKQSVPLHKILHEDYSYTLEESVEIEQFLLPMLEVMDEKRISARDCLKSQWLWK